MEKDQLLELILKIDDKLDRFHTEFVQINITLAKQEESLASHIKRTEILEQQIVPINRNIYMLQGVAKFFGASTLLVGLVAGILKIYHLL